MTTCRRLSAFLNNSAVVEDIFLLYQIPEGGIELFRRNMKTEELCYMVLLAVGKQVENLLACLLLALLWVPPCSL